MKGRLGLWARRLIPFACAAATVAVLAIGAAAHHFDLRDANDTNGTLDIREVRLIHEGSPTELSVLTFSSWTTHGIWDRGSVIVYLDTRADEAPEYYVVVRSVGSGVAAEMWRDVRDGNDRRLFRVATWRRSRVGVSIRVPVKRLGFGPRRSSYRWFVQTLFTGAKCKATCLDRAPDEGAVEQWRPGMSPTPPTTPSPS